MKYKKIENYILLSLQNGDYINKSIQRLFRKEKLNSGWVNGLGAIYDIELGCYDLNKKEYIRKIFTGEYELTSLTGNITFLNNEYFVHTHITISNNQFEGTGGHLFDAKISATGEFKIELLNTKINRKFSKDIGLNLWCLEREDNKNR